MKPKTNGTNGQQTSESFIQFDIFAWHWNNYPTERGRLFAVPNGGHRNAREGATLKATGPLPGVADLLYIGKGGQLYCFEIKTPIGRQSDAQKQWQAVAEAAGAKYYIIRNLAEFQKIFGEFE